jgi:hypothetical protein
LHLRNWLSEHRRGDEPPLPGVAAMRGDYELFQVEIEDILHEKRMDRLELLEHNDLLWAFTDWIAKRAAMLAAGAG